MGDLSESQGSFFSPLVSSRGIRDDIEEEDDQVSDPHEITTATVSFPQQ